MTFRETGGWPARRESKIGLQANTGAASTDTVMTDTVTDTVAFLALLGLEPSKFSFIVCR